MSSPNDDGEDATSPSIPPTEMIYYSYDGNFELDCTATILHCRFIDDTSANVALDRTVLHAQGGGQPTDIGNLVLDDENDTALDVTKVVLDRSTGVASHTIATTAPPTKDLVGRSVRVRVDEANRRILSECHTAGHVVDAAMARCGATMPPKKAYHFLDGPYVEYKGTLGDSDRASLLERLQAAFVELVDADIPTEIHNVGLEQAEAMCDGDCFPLRDMFQPQDTVRVVRVAGWPCPCGGTHVRSTADLKARNWGITGFRSKKGVVRVKYGQDWNKTQA